MFADELLLHKTIHTVQHYLDLPADVDALAEWLVDFKLTLNVEKCIPYCSQERGVVLFQFFYYSLLRRNTHR